MKTRPDLPAPDEARLREIRARLAEIPPPPVVVKRILAALSNPKASAKTVSDIASSDPSLSAALLKAVNVAAHGLTQPVTNIKQAITLLGFIRVRSLVLQFGLADLIGTSERTPGYGSSALWAHSLATSFLADRIARRAIGVDEGFASTLGLLHDIGKLAMNSRFPDDVARMFAADAPFGKTFLAREVECFGTTHAFVGGELAETWLLPPELCEAIYYHHSFKRLPENLEPPVRRAIFAVLVANQLAKYLHVHSEDLEIDLVPDACFEEIGLEPPLEAHVDAETKRAVTSAILFIEQLMPRPLGSFPRLFRIQAARESAGRRILEETATSIDVGPCRLLESFPTPGPVAIPVAAGQEAAADGAVDVAFEAEVEAGALEALSRSFRRYLRSCEVGTRIELPLHFLVRVVLGSALRSKTKAARLRLRVRRLPSAFLLHLESPALEFPPGPVDRHRSATLLAAGLGNAVALEWIDRVETDDAGANWVFFKEWAG